jgi:hypothetical protein
MVHRNSEIPDPKFKASTKPGADRFQRIPPRFAAGSVSRIQSAKEKIRR